MNLKNNLLSIEGLARGNASLETFNLSVEFLIFTLMKNLNDPVEDPKTMFRLILCPV